MRPTLAVGPGHGDHGEQLARRPREAEGSPESLRYVGVAHEFFGMGLVVANAKQAVAMASADRRMALVS